MRLEEEQPGRSFDVICAGEALWTLATPRGLLPDRSASLHLAPGGGAVNVALTLARHGLRVGLATVLTDDPFGHGWFERIAEAGVDVSGVALSPHRRGFVLVDAGGGANEVAVDDQQAPPLEVPEGWSSRLLVLSGLSPVVSHAAALCKVARAARRQGTTVLLDFDASLQVWAGREPRTVRMVLREADVARCSLADLAVLGMDVESVRATLRPSAVLVVSHGAGGAVALGPFGEVAFVPPDSGSRTITGAGDAFTSALCAELLRPSTPGESAGARFHRALVRGNAAASARSRVA